MSLFDPYFWKNLDFLSFFLLLIKANLLMFVSTALIVFLLRRYFIQFDLNLHNTKMSKRDYKLAGLVLISNVMVGVLGFYLMKLEMIHLTSKGLFMTFLDVVFLMLAIDFGMYFSHFITHKSFLYRLTHSIHHEHESMSNLSLYVMHPLEAFGFGVILMALLFLRPVDVSALLFFIFLNWILGVFAHSGIEPSKGEWANYFCMTRFHQIHHENPNKNFGFYTPLWDILFKTREHTLKKELISHKN